MEVLLQFTDRYLNVIVEKMSALLLGEPSVCQISPYADSNLTHRVRIGEALQPLMVNQLVSQL
jgi:hypothetical protein